MLLYTPTFRVVLSSIVDNSTTLKVGVYIERDRLLSSTVDNSTTLKGGVYIQKDRLS